MAHDFPPESLVCYTFVEQMAAGAVSHLGKCGYSCCVLAGKVAPAKRGLSNRRLTISALAFPVYRFRAACTDRPSSSISKFVRSGVLTSPPPVGNLWRLQTLLQCGAIARRRNVSLCSAYSSLDSGSRNRVQVAPFRANTTRTVKSPTFPRSRIFRR